MKKSFAHPPLSLLTACIATTIISAEAVSAITGIDEVIVTSDRIEETIPLDLKRYGNDVEIVTADDIRQHGFADVTQTLQMLVPGLHIAPKNGPFDYFNASLQGSRNQDILWLVDGVRITNRLYNSTGPLDTIPAHMIERIEVLKGGQGIFYGTQSVGGVINIVTRGFSDKAQSSVSAGVDSNEGYNVNGLFRGSLSDHQFVAYASHDEAEGYLPFRAEDVQPSATDRERGYDVNSLGLKYAWNIDDASRLSLHYQYNQADLDFARPFLNNKTINAREESIVTVKYDLQLSDNFGLFIKAYHHSWDTKYTRIYNQLDGSGNLTSGLRVLNDESYWGYEDYGVNAMAKFNFHYGLEYILGFDQQNFSGEDEVWRIADQEERVNAPFVQLRTTEDLFDNTMIALGVRFNQPSNAENVTVWNLTAKQKFLDNYYVQGNVGTSFRLPDAEALFLNEIYDENNDGIPDDGYFAIGNPELEPEESENINLSIGGELDRFSFEATYFTRDITHYIQSYVPIFIGGVEGETFANTDDEVDIDGYELVTNVSLTKEIVARLSFTATSAKLNNDGPQLVGIPGKEGKVVVSYQPSKRPFGLSFSSNIVGDVNDRSNSERGNYTVIDLSGFYQFGSNQQHEWVARIENITDKEYATAMGVGTADATASSYLYQNLGMERTLHFSYTYSF